MKLKQLQEHFIMRTLTTNFAENAQWIQVTLCK